MENIDVFDFELSTDDMAAIDGLETGKRGGPEPDAITLETFGRDIPETRPRSPRRLTMEYRPLGRTGVQVSNLCLGTMMFGAWGNQDHDDSVRIIHAALDAGVNLIDTADVYSAGESEEIVGKALKGRRDDVVLARSSSCRWARARTSAADRGAGSSARSRTHCVDSAPTTSTSYQVHRPSQDTDVEETLSALTDLVRQGKIRYIGSSSYSGSQIV